MLRCGVRSLSGIRASASQADDGAPPTCGAETGRCAAATSVERGAIAGAACLGTKADAGGSCFGHQSGRERVQHKAYGTSPEAAEQAERWSSCKPQAGCASAVGADSGGSSSSSRAGAGRSSDVRPRPGRSSGPAAGRGSWRCQAEAGRRANVHCRRQRPADTVSAQS